MTAHDIATVTIQILKAEISSTFFCLKVLQITAFNCNLIEYFTKESFSKVY